MNDNTRDAGDEPGGDDSTDRRGGLGGRRVRSERTAPSVQCEQGVGEAGGTVTIELAKGESRAVVWADVDGLAVLEGDIVLGTVEEARTGYINPPPPLPGDGPDTGPDTEEGLAFGIGITGAQFRWPNARVPFEIDPALPNQQRVTDAIAHWHAVSHIRLVARNGEADYVRFVPGGGCSSMVGRRGGQQNITLGDGCSAGSTIHEIGHALGLWHEQSREDRDSFVRINWANIQAGTEHNFNQHITDGDDLGGYDFGSIMHYPRYAFSSNGQPTIEPLSPLPAGVIQGQRTGLSAGDLAAIRVLYPVVKQFWREPGHTIKELIKEPFTEPVTLKEPFKEPFTFKELANDPVTIREPFGTLVEGRPSIQEGQGSIAEGTGRLPGGLGINPELIARLQAAARQQEVGQPAAEGEEPPKSPWEDPTGLTEPNPPWGTISPDGASIYLGGWVPITVEPFHEGGALPFLLQRRSAFGEQYQALVEQQAGLAASPADELAAALAAHGEAVAQLQFTFAAVQAALTQATQP